MQERGSDFFLRHRVYTGSGAYPASYVIRTGNSFPDGKRPGLEADHSSPPSAEVKNAWSYKSTPHTRLHGVMFK